ncbi:MAG: SpoIID/LytB domain-containing protein [Arthrospira sp. PLM2.Bin9]|nr:SpoIID/LytB domain-containing protein [Arthrospira sp. PLM2.Bin9]TVU52322.1 MAG: SpoIID/LytB domain-containing protein [Arthrospira sp. PLM2.Bin9]
MINATTAPQPNLYSRSSDQCVPKSLAKWPMVLMFGCLLGLTPNKAIAQEEINPILEVGVVQQFGKTPTDTLVLQAKPGDHLTLRFATPQGEQILHTLSAVIQVEMQPLPEPQVKERLIFSSHRSYETAAQQANKWQEMGIEVELAQPDVWQVWASRETYSTPLLRRWLLESIKAQGYQPTFTSQAVTQKPVPYWILGGYRYNRQELKIEATQNIISVGKKRDDPQALVYGGSLKLQPDAYGTYTLVNHVPLETYLRGVVPHEMGAWPPAASIEAQAILARTYVLRNLHRFEADNYQICANTDCQVYKGLTEVYPSTDNAITNTRGLVLTYDGELVDAVYFSSSGGITANFNDVWDGPKPPYLRSVLDTTQNVWNLESYSLADEQNFRRFMTLRKGFNEEGWSDFRWQYRTDLKAMTNHLQFYLKRRKSPQADFKTIQQVRVVERARSGRVLKMEVETDRGVIPIHKDEVQSAFWPPISTLFYIDPIYGPNQTLQGYNFVGGGFGHGVGFSQIGSHKLARLGWSSDRILEFYFPGTQLQPLNNSLISWHQSP